jgi:hypothetical protein
MCSIGETGSAPFIQISQTHTIITGTTGDPESALIACADDMQKTFAEVQAQALAQVTAVLRAVSGESSDDR